MGNFLRKIFGFRKNKPLEIPLINREKNEFLERQIYSQKKI